MNRSMCSVFQKLHSARVLQGTYIVLGTPAKGEREDLRCPPPRSDLRGYREILFCLYTTFYF